MHIYPKVRVRSSSGLGSSRAPTSLGAFEFPWPFENTAPVDKSATNPAKRLSAATSGPSKTLHLSTNPSKWPSKTMRLSANPRKRLGCARGSKTPHFPTNPAKRLSGATSGPSKTLHLSTNPRKWLRKHCTCRQIRETDSPGSLGAEIGCCGATGRSNRLLRSHWALEKGTVRCHMQI